MEIMITHAIVSGNGTRYYAIPKDYEDPQLAQLNLVSVSPLIGNDKDWLIVYPVQGSEEDVASLQGKAIELKLEDSAIPLSKEVKNSRWFCDLRVS